MQIYFKLVIIANGLQIRKAFNKGLTKGKIMKNKGKLLLAFCGMLLINSTTVSAASVADNIVAANYAIDEIYETDMTGENVILSDGVKVILAKKDKKEEKAGKKSKITKKKKKNKVKNNKKKNNKKKNNKKRNSNKKNSSKKNKDKKNKKDKMEKKNNIDIKEEDVNKLPETDKYKPELKEKDNQNNGGGEITPPGGGQTETLSKDYAVLCDYTDKKGNLRFQDGNSIVLPEKGYVGLKANGENTGKEIEIVWSGSSLQNIKDGVKGSYTLTAIPKENIIIGGKDYGMVKFVVNIIVE